MTSPLDYSLCNQTVTVYRKEKSTIRKQQISGCYFTWEEVQTEDEFGVRRETKCLLILPGDDQRVFIGDRVYNGVGPDVSIREWGSFIPVNVAGLAEINYVAPYYWEGELCHIEAGRK